MLDAAFRIRAVDAAWSEFAEANGAPELVAPGPLGHSVFAYIQDSTTAELYGRLFEKVLWTGQPLEFPFRCDSPALRRFLEMEITPSGVSGLRLRTRVCRLEARAPERLLERAHQRGGELLRMCGWCKAIEVAGRWSEVEDAVATLRLFEREVMPTTTHGICPRCYERMVRLLE